MTREIEELLERFQKAGLDMVAEDKGKTIFEVTGYPHYENVASNILAFLFDPDEEHQMEDLWLKALLKSYFEMAGGKKEYDNGAHYESVKVRREVKTSNGKFIDIVVELDEMVIAIENKIYAQVYNDLDEYKSFITEKYSNKSCKFVLLTLKDKGNEGEFINLTYAHIFSNLADYEIDGKWGCLVEDFRRNIESMTIDIDRKAYDFVKEETNKVAIHQLLEILREQFIGKHDYLQSIKGMYNKDIPENERFTSYGRNSFDGYQGLYKEYLSNSLYIVTYELFFMNSPIKDSYDNCLYHSIWIKDEKQRSEMGRIKAWVDSMLNSGKKTESMSSPDWGEYFCVFKDDFSNKHVTCEKMKEINKLINKGIRCNWDTSTESQ